MEMKLRKTLAAVVAALSLAAAFAASAEPASAYSTTTNWYSKTWWFNKSETYRIAWVDPNPATALQGIIGMPWQLRAALTAYGYSFKWMAREARSRNACLSIFWIYVNLPVPQMYRGARCY
jgi:hypothetical protein